MRKLMLRTDVESLGRIGDLVEVADGYARNYLIPQGLALEPTDANIKRIEEQKKIVEARRAKELAEKQEVASRLEGLEVTIVAKATPEGHLFGSVGPKEIADALSNEGYNIDEKQIRLDEHIKQVDKYTVPVRFAEEVSCDIVVWVAPEKSEQGEEGQESVTTDDGDSEIEQP